MTKHDGHNPGKPGPDSAETRLEYETREINDDWELVMVPAGHWRRTEWAAEVVAGTRSGDPKTTKNWSEVSVGSEAETRPHLVPRTEMARQFVELMGSEGLAIFGQGIPTGYFEDPTSGEWRIAIRYRAASPEQLEESINRLIEWHEKYKRGEIKRQIAEEVVARLSPDAQRARTTALIAGKMREDARDMLKNIGVSSSKVGGRLDKLVEIFEAFLSIERRKEEFLPFHSTTEFGKLERRLTRPGMTEDRMLAEIDLAIARCATVLEEWQEYDRQQNTGNLN